MVYIYSLFIISMFKALSIRQYFDTNSVCIISMNYINQKAVVQDNYYSTSTVQTE
jgi:hypothetical protein